MRLLIVVTCALLHPLSAEACPTSPADIEAGIRVSYVSGETSEFRLDAATGRVTETYSDTGGYRAVNDLELGIHLVSWADVQADGTVSDTSRSAYLFGADLPLDIAPGMTWSVPYRIVGAAAGSEGVYSGQVGAATELTIGSCSYDALPVSMYYYDPGYLSLARVDYIPALGLGVFIASGEIGGYTTLLIPSDIEAMTAP